MENIRFSPSFAICFVSLNNFFKFSVPVPSHVRWKCVYSISNEHYEEKMRVYILSTLKKLLKCKDIISIILLKIWWVTRRGGKSNLLNMCWIKHIMRGKITLILQIFLFWQKTSFAPSTPLTGRRYLREKEAVITPVASATQSVSRLQSIVAGLKNAPSEQLTSIFE